jgi:hypothetical protein
MAKRLIKQRKRLHDVALISAQGQLYLLPAAYSYYQGTSTEGNDKKQTTTHSFTSFFNLIPYLISWRVLLISSTVDDVLGYVHYYFTAGNNANCN